MRVLIWLMTVLLGALLYLLVVGDGGLLSLRDQMGEAQRLKEENERLAERNRILSAELEDLRSGLEGIEGLARDRHGMIREGEEFYQLVGPEVGEYSDELVAPATVPDMPRGRARQP